ncbi:uncharacterized protein YjiS (DUF1127 family) [Rhodopseudomonas thermotolerans]|uniref:Uncharacterized protein YjiS n=2 Tax=Rhodopseudomonas TaxID=1073 RepID=A0A336JUA0_9BRAD|nr:uncharacterized protein YjiS (DUF1127 family) [Rhodopseudomonas pentothenatexigens]REF92468.1 uncharacterized protein YjiS (DUF1127 family) [Rhodopseudomonas thermotolerans]SSW92313.1 uncharacterized protein YjiS [Rhodopseudomonas pentothenatexigens]
MSTCSDCATIDRRRSRGVWARLGATLALWRRRRSGRTDLAGFSARELRDLGLSRGDMIHETAKPFWRA